MRATAPRRSYSLLSDVSKAATTTTTLRALSARDRSRAIAAFALELEKHKAFVLDENKCDCDRFASLRGVGRPSFMMSPVWLGRIIDNVRTMATIEDPVGTVLSETRNASNGLLVRKVSTPVGLVGFFYKYRPRLTADAISICLRSGNAALLDGGISLLSTNRAIVSLAHRAMESTGLPPAAILLNNYGLTCDVDGYYHDDPVLDLQNGGNGAAAKTATGDSSSHGASDSSLSRESDAISSESETPASSSLPFQATSTEGNAAEQGSSSGNDGGMASTAPAQVTGAVATREASKRRPVSRDDAKDLATVSIKQWLRMTNLVDTVVPCGSRSLLDFARDNTTIPVVCGAGSGAALYVDASADPAVARAVVRDSGQARPQASNSLRRLVIHRAFPGLSGLLDSVVGEDVLLVGDAEACAACRACTSDAGISSGATLSGATTATVAVTMVGDAAEGISVLRRTGTGFVEGIVASDASVIDVFVASVGAAMVPVNSSTRNCSGTLMGLGTDVALSTSSALCRGPVSAAALCTYKYVLSSTDGAMA